ncbi:MAG TPA: hypothetical protein VL132_05125 [Planctomycetaceae bacterium]|nr:hypothetical protein [Planctomycetaceae bacterium]
MAQILWQLEVDDAGLRQRLNQWSGRAAAAPGNAVQQAGVALLQNIIAANPVDSGRSRSAWVAALEDLGGSPPDGWEGNHPDPAAIADGASLGSAEFSDNGTHAEVSFFNGVDYIDLLEYGDIGRRPRAMVRRNLPAALAELAARLLEGMDRAES